MKRGMAIWFVSAIVLLQAAAGFEIATVYYLGDCLPSSSPIGYISDDPALYVVAVPATRHQGWFTQDEVDRALRLYMPRTYDQLAEGDLILLSDVRADTLSTRWLTWFSRGIVEDGLSLMMIGGILSFGGYTDSPSWGMTTIGPLLPVELVERETVDIDWRPEIVTPEDPLISALPWRSCPHFGGYNRVGRKEGAKLLATTNDNERNPFMAFSNVGSGRSFAFCTDWTPGWGVEFMKWDYYPDFTVYSVYYSLGRRVPQDLQLMHRVRAEFVGYTMERSVLVSLLDFVARLGGNTVPLENEISSAQVERERADALYLEQDYEGCLEALEDAKAELKRISEDSMRVKERALMWIWMVEWLVVTATAMVCGFVLWTLMVKRRLYREVSATRSRS
jgi:uncharacterized membrane protein